MRLIDTHLHTIHRRRLSYPWLAGVAALDKDFSLDLYQIEARRCGITDALHMEVDVAEADMEAETRHVASLAGDASGLVRGAIAACRPESPQFPTFLERQGADPFVKGFRRVLHVVADEVSQTPLFRENVARLAGAGRPFDICVRPDQIELAIALIDACPNVRFVLDHCGAPAVATGAWHPWREHISAAARRANVAVKISGVVAYANGDTWTLDDIRPYVEHAIACFGWDRVVWGSDWPVCTLTSSLSNWIAATHALLNECGASERARLFHLNAERIWRI